ncbi:hypothetical protein QQF64_003203 [Cirrhinus molitorella]|uniref:Uncharacterized protein n=1 Tax=Cirrhinus molitorella TaxID=172907 RepID=A0ABR3MJC3_9TELE
MGEIGRGCYVRQNGGKDDQALRRSSPVGKSMRVEWTGSAASVRAHAHQHTATLLRSASIGGCRCCCGKATRQILAKRAERVAAVMG